MPAPSEKRLPAQVGKASEPSRPSAKSGAKRCSRASANSSSAQPRGPSTATASTLSCFQSLDGKARLPGFLLGCAAIQPATADPHPLRNIAALELFFKRVQLIHVAGAEHERQIGDHQIGRVADQQYRRRAGYGPGGCLLGRGIGHARHQRQRACARQACVSTVADVLGVRSLDHDRQAVGARQRRGQRVGQAARYASRAPFGVRIANFERQAHERALRVRQPLRPSLPAVAARPKDRCGAPGPGASPAGAAPAARPCAPPPGESAARAPCAAATRQAAKGDRDARAWRPSPPGCLRARPRAG